MNRYTQRTPNTISHALHPPSGNPGSACVASRVALLSSTETESISFDVFSGSGEWVRLELAGVLLDMVRELRVTVRYTAAAI